MAYGPLLDIIVFLVCFSGHLFLTVWGVVNGSGI